MACPLVIITNAVVCLTLTLGAHVEALTCDGGHSPKYLSHDPYGNQMCQKCSKCPPGSGVSVECQGSRDTVCERCPEGTYSGTWSATRICLPCTMCSPHQRTIRECTSTRNAKCVKNCDVGFYLDTLSDNCEMCSWCFPDRPELFTPRLDDCMRSEIPVDYQCMQSAYEHRPFVMSSRSESTLPVTNQEYSEDREAVQLGDTGDGNSKDAMFNIVTAKDRFGVATTKNFLSRGTTIPTCKGNERDLTKVNTGPPIGMLTRIDVEQTEKWKSAAHHTPIIIMILSIITTIAIAIPIVVLITYRNRRITRSNEKESLLKRSTNFVERGHERASIECNTDTHPEYSDIDDQNNNNNEDECTEKNKPNKKYYNLGVQDDTKRLPNKHSYGGSYYTLNVETELNQSVRSADLIERKSQIESVLQINVCGQPLSEGSRINSLSRDSGYEQDIDDKMCSLDEHIMLSEQSIFSDNGTRV